MMPRRRTKQPDPLHLEVHPDLIIEVRDRATWLISRGSHKNRDWLLAADAMALIAFDDYFKTDTGDPADLYWNPPQGKDDYLRSASSFARKMEGKGYGSVTGDDQSLRKRSYPYVLEQITNIKHFLDEQLK